MQKIVKKDMMVKDLTPRTKRVGSFLETYAIINVEI